MNEDGVFRCAERQFRPWKNGGGETAEIVASPAGAGFEDFDWRISTAVVAASGPFSTFPGVDRVLCVLEGGAMVLTMDEREVRLDAASPPLAFPGDVAVSAALEGAALLDFNVMVRRPWRATVARSILGLVAGDATEHFALLLEDRAGLRRFDLLGTGRAPALVGARVLDVRIYRGG